MKKNIPSANDILISKEEAEKLQLPLEVVTILAGVGLPNAAPLGVSFQKCRRITHDRGGEGEEVLYAIGRDDGSTICIKRDGTVISIDDSGHELRKVNTKLSYFLVLLEMYSRYAEKVQLLDDGAGEAFAIRMGAEMKAVDPDAFVNPNGWWPLITQQMELGML